MRKVTVELIQNLSAALTEKERQLAEALALIHDLSAKLAVANAALSGFGAATKALASPGSQVGEVK